MADSAPIPFVDNQNAGVGPVADTPSPWETAAAQNDTQPSTPAPTPTPAQPDNGAQPSGAAQPSATGGATGGDTKGATPGATPGAPEPGSPEALKSVTFPATTPPPAPPIVTPQQRPGILGLVDKIADTLAGKTKPEMGRDQYGNEYVKQTSLTRGQQWLRIGAGLLHGAAAGLGAGRGGNIGGAAAAGFAAGAQDKQGQQQNEANMSAAARQQNLDNMNNQMLRMEMAKQSMVATRMQTEASQHDIEFAQGQEKHYTDAGGTVLGIMAHPGDLNKILKVNPDVMQDMIQKHQIELVPHMDADGKRDGVSVIKMPGGYRSTMLPAGAEFHTWQQPTDKEPGKYVSHQSAEPITQGEIDDYNHKAGIDALDFQTKKAENDLKTAQAGEATAKAKETPSIIAKNYGEAGHAAAETKALNEATDGTQIAANAKQLVEGTMDPSNLSKRAKSYDATLTAANAYSMQTTGKPFDIAKAAGDYKFATNKGTYDTLNYLNSLTGRDNASGNLGAVVTMSNKLGQTQFPAVNDVAQWAKLAAGNPQIAAYHAALVETSDQIAKILQGGGGGGTSDAKLKQANELLNKGFNPSQIAATAGTLRTLLANRKQEIIGDNRYLQSWHGNPQSVTPRATGGGAGGGTVSLAAAMALPQNQGKTKDQVQADITAHGYQPIP